jgi:hypothetical protein
MQDYRDLMEEMVGKPCPADLGKLLKGYISSDSPVMWTLSRVVLQANALANSLTAIDFTVDAGRFEAIRQQGVIQGLLMAVDIALAPAQEELDGRQ